MTKVITAFKWISVADELPEPRVKVIKKGNKEVFIEIERSILVLYKGRVYYTYYFDLSKPEHKLKKSAWSFGVAGQVPSHWQYFDVLSENTKEI